MLILSLYLSALQLLLIVNQTPNVPVELSSQVNSLVQITRDLYEKTNTMDTEKTQIGGPTTALAIVAPEAPAISPVGFWGVLEKQNGKLGELFGIEARIRYSDGSVKMDSDIRVMFDDDSYITLDPAKNNQYDFMLNHSQIITFKFGDMSTTTKITAK